ncbi:PfkB family carbohydrate kinase [Microbulbifer thermotolerans]|uniref:PfkB family carbohydrate kinase n=1 Tax=Microbulbifer thermotolerans TaxID=252514 RepID=UPI00224A8B79|nr:PfkB family carbohydrate kinase [Microbulbifer thermotolerans]MCX2778928.1 PfkB family carbohydrate kinase [Microbulbifer thermotolerans]MCX2804233.1 PfkB family carbohydrate kinase [Microbulbifer thermotolerans]
MCAARVAVFGEALIDLIETLPGRFEFYVGGSPFNVCRGFARQGLVCDYLSPISCDRMGERIAAVAAAEGIHCDRVPRSLRPTSLALVTVDSDGQPSYSLYREGVADLDIDSARLVAAVHPECQLFHTGSLALVPSMEAQLRALFSNLRSRGISISIDANLRPGVVPDNKAYLATVRGLIDCADVLKVSDEDLELLGIEQPLEFCRDLVRHGTVQLVAFTEGAGGATLITREAEVAQRAVAPSSVVDTVGAGDTFFSALLASLLRKDGFARGLAALSAEELEELLTVAQWAASINISRKGCNPPTLAELEAVLPRTPAS